MMMMMLMLKPSPRASRLERRRQTEEREENGEAGSGALAAFSSLSLLFASLLFFVFAFRLDCKNEKNTKRVRVFILSLSVIPPSSHFPSPPSC